MAQHDGGARHPSQQMMDVAAELTAVTTGHSATYRRTWEDELGDTPEARAAAAAWCKWDIETPAVLLRSEWFGGQIARFYDWINPPDPRMRELFGLTYLDVAREEWWKLKWHTHVEFLQKLLASGLSPSEAASVLHVSQKLSRGRRLNETALMRTSSVFKQGGLPMYPRNVWILQDATVAQIEKLHASVFFGRYGRKEWFEKGLSWSSFRLFVISHKLKSLEN